MVSPLALVTAFLLVVSSLGVAQSSPQAITSAHAAARSHRDADPASHQGVVPNWQKITTWQAVWPRPLSENSMYWTTDASAPTSSTLNTQVNMLWEAYDWSADMTTYKTRAAMAFKRVATGTPTLNDNLFTVMAMARFGGNRNNPDAPMSMYFWDHYANSSNGSLSCTSGYTPIIRVTSDSPDVYWACLPVHDNYVGNGFQPRLGNANSAGGEADQYTGNLYVLQGINATVDNQTQTSRNANTSSGWVFSVWNPVTGAYSLSGAIQPGDWKQGMTTVPKERVKIRQRVDGTNNFDTPHSPADMALDSDGNGYTYTGSSTSQNATYGTGNASLVRFEPARDASGDIIDGTADNPWRYYVVTKIKKDPAFPTQYWSAPGEIYGNAFLNGQYFNAAYTATYNRPANFPTTGSAGARGTTNMVKVDPMSGTAKIVWSTLNDDLTTQTARDNASPQEAEVIRGSLWNDVNGNGKIEDDEPGIDAATVAIYDSSGKLRGTQQTDANGNYSFLVGGDANTTYYIRPVQVQLPLADGTAVNAAQTWGAGSVTTGRGASGETLTNTAAIRCLGGDVTADGGGVCHGALPQGSPDPAIGAIGTVEDKTTWLNYATVEMQTSQHVGYADFGFTVFGSYGDAAAGPSGANAPAHVNNLDPAQRVWLGDVLGGYDGPSATDAHNSDDGVYLDSPIGKIPLTPGTVLAATKQYPLAATLSGDARASATVKGWVTGAGDDNWGPSAAWNPTVAGDVASGTFQFLASGTVTGTPTGQLRVQASTATITAPTNASGQYQAIGGSSTQPWTTPGEIEDYQIKLADAVYRPAAATVSGAGTFTVDGQGLTADAASVKIGNSVAASALAVKTVTATVPNSLWTIRGVEVLDTATGKPATWANPTITAAATSTTVSFTPALGDDLTVKVVYAKPPDPDRSTLKLYLDQGLTQAGDTVGVNSPLWGLVTVLDADGNPLAGETVTFTKQSAAVTWVGGSTCVTNADGQCSAQVTSAVAGTYASELSATVTGTTKAVSGSPATIAFTAAAVDPVKSTLSLARTNAGAAEVPANGTDSWTATVTAKDSGGNPVPNQPVSFGVFDPGTSQAAPGAVIGGGCTTSALGVCSVTVTSTKAGSVEVRASVPALDGSGPAQVAGSPATAAFTAGPVDPGKSSLSVSSGIALVGGSVTATVTAVDAHGNPVPSASFDLSLTGSATFNGAQTVVCTTPTATTGTGAGKCAVTLTDATAELVDVHASFQGAEVGSSPQTVEFSATGPCALNSTFTVARTSSNPDAAKVVANGSDSWTGTVTLRDCSAGQNLVKGAAGWLVFDTDPDVTVSQPVDNNDGTYTVTFKSVKASDAYTATASLGSDLIGSARDIPFQPGPVDPGKSALAVSPSQTGVNGTATATVTTTDAYGNLVGAESVVFQLGGSATFANLNSCTTGTSGAGLGKCSVDFTDAKAETVDVNARIGGVLTGGSPAKVTFTQGGFCQAPGTSSFTVTPATQTAGGSVSAVLTAKDCAGNVLANLDPAKVAFASSVPGLTTGAVTNTGNGTYTATLTATQADTYPVTAAYDAQATNDSPRTVTFTSQPKPNPVNSTMTLAKQSATVGEQVTVTVTTKDSYDNPVANQQVPVTSDKSGTIAGTCLTGTNGVCTVTVTDQVAETVGVYASVDGVGVAGSGQTVTFSAGPVDPGKSALAVSPAQTGVNGTATATVTTTDAYGNLVGAESVVFQLGGSATFANLNSCTTGTSGAGLGKCSVDFTDAKAETVDVNARIGGVLTGGSPAKVTFTQGGFCQAPGTSSFTVTPATQTAGGSVSAVLTAKDCAGNSLANLDPAKVAFASSVSGLTTGAVTNTGNGTYTATLTATQADTYPVTAAYDAQATNDSPRTVTFTADPVVCVTGCAGTASYAQVTRDGALNDDTEQDVVTAYAFDRYGNPLSGVTVSTTPAATLHPVATSVTTGVDGTAQLRYTSLTKGAQDAAVAFDNAGTVAVTLHFVDVPPDPTTSSVSISPTTSQKVDSVFTITATVRGAQGQPVEGAMVSFAKDSANLVFLDSPTCVSRADGTCELQATSTKSGGYHVEVTVLDASGASQPVRNSPVTATFTAGTVCVPGTSACPNPDPGVDQTSVRLVTDGAAADDTARDAAILKAYDSHGNPVSGVVVTSVPGDPDLRVQAIAPTDTTGATTIYYTSGVAGKHTAEVLIGADRVPGSPVEPSFTRQGVPNPPTITSPTAGPNKDRPLVVAGTGEPGATVTVTDNGREVTCAPTPVVDANGQWSCSVALPDGGHSIVVRQTDPDGNQSADAAAVVIVVDTVAPAKPVIEVANQTQISGTAEEGSTVTVRDAADKVLCTAVVGAGGKWRCDTPPGTPSGEITAVVTDPAGNTGPAQTATLDTEKPAPPKVNDTDGSVVSGTGEPGGKVTVTDPSGKPVPGCVGVAIDPVTGMFACAPATPIPPGSGLLVTVTDKAGNVSDATRITVRPLEAATEVPIGTGGAVVDGAPLALVGGLLVAAAVAVMAVVGRRRKETASR